MEGVFVMSNIYRHYIKKRLPDCVHWFIFQVMQFGFLMALKRYLFFKIVNLKSNIRNGRNSISSELEIDVVIPCVDKDVDTLPYVIESVRTHIKHPINKIFIIAPKSKMILEVCKKKEVLFIDEDTVLQIRKKDIKYKVNGTDRSGWLYQQLLKLGAISLTDMAHYLVLDADTVFISDQVFEYKNLILLDCSDEHHRPYFDFIERTLDFETKCPVSFVSHHSLIRKCLLQDLQKRLENKYNCFWYEAIINNIDQNQLSSFSEYETYGHFIYKHHRSQVYVEYWSNESISRRDIVRLDELKKIFSKVRKSLSFHSYNR
jgi:hypothetical protein